MEGGVKMSKYIVQDIEDNDALYKCDTLEEAEEIRSIIQEKVDLGHNNVSEFGEQMRLYKLVETTYYDLDIGMSETYGEPIGNWRTVDDGS